MESNQNKYLALSLAFLVVLSGALFLGTREENLPEIDPAYFAVTDTERIDRVQLVTGPDTVDLSYDGSHWKVNGRYDADVQMIKVLMATLRQVEPHRPVATAMRDTVMSQLTTVGTRVTLSEAGQPSLKFLAGGNRQQTESWFVKDGEALPMVMIIPGYRVFVSGIFQMRANGWRNKRIFEFNWRNFKSLTATYPKEPAQGFTVELKEHYFGITGLEEVDTTRLNDYLDAVSLLMAKRFVSGADIKDPTEVLASIEIKDIGNRTYSLELFKPRDADTEIYGRMTGGQLVTFDRDAIPSIVRRRTNFVVRDTR